MTETSYVSNYQQYLNSKGSGTLDASKSYNDATKTKSIRGKSPAVNCKLCKLLSRREDQARILNQGLYNKYTSRLDYFYTKDINSVILKKKKPFTIQFKDDQIFYDDQEYLKKFNQRKEIKVHMIDIQNFYSRFKDYPRCFDAKLFGIINAAIRKHRRIEYLKVFKGKQQEEKDPPLPEEEYFDFLEMLGESFKHGVDRKIQSLGQMTNDVVQRGRAQTPTGQKSFVEIKKNFRELVQYNDFEQTDHKFSSDYYQYHTTGVNYFQLYSRTDSLSAVNDLGDIIEEFSTTRKEQQLKPVIKSEVVGLKKSSSIISESANGGENKQGYASVHTLTDQKEGADKKPGIQETRELVSKTNSQTNSNNPSQDVITVSTSTARIKRYGTQYTNRIISVPLTSKNQNVNNVAEEIKQQQLPRTTFRNSSGNKYENSHRDTQRVEGQSTQISSNNYRNQPGGNLATGSSQFSISKSKTDDGGKYFLEEEKKKLMLDVKDLQADKQNLYKSINQKWQTTTNKGQVALSVKLFTPGAESSATVTNKDFQKEGLPSGKRYIATKRTVAATKSTIYEQSSGGLSGSPIQSNKYYKNTSQGVIEKQPLMTSASKVTIDKKSIQDELLQDSVRNRIPEIDSLSRGSKAYVNSRKLLEKVFASDSNQKMVPALIKTPSSNNYRQIKVLNTQSQEDYPGPLTAKNINIGTMNSAEYEKLPSPYRNKYSNGGNKAEFFQSNVSTSQMYVNKAKIAKIDTEMHPQNGKNIILSPKIVLPSPTEKLQPYRDSLGGKTKKRNFSTENGNGQYLSPKFSNGLSGQIHARQKSSDVMLYGVHTYNCISPVNKFLH